MGLVKGPWNLGRWSKPIGAVAVGWVAFIIPVLCFPAVKGKDLNDLDMNYTVCTYIHPSPHQCSSQPRTFSATSLIKRHK